MSEEKLKLVPILVGVGVVAVSALVAKMILDMKKKKKVALEDPNVKYALKLIEKQELSHDTRLFRGCNMINLNWIGHLFICFGLFGPHLDDK